MAAHLAGVGALVQVQQEQVTQGQQEQVTLSAPLTAVGRPRLPCPALPCLQSESASCLHRMPSNKHPLLPNHTMSISQPDTLSDDAAQAMHSNSNSYTPGTLAAEVAQEETQHNGSRLRVLSSSGMEQPQALLQAQVQQQFLHKQPSLTQPQVPQAQPQLQQPQQQQPHSMSQPFPTSVFSMQTIQEQQVHNMQQQQQQQQPQQPQQPTSLPSPQQQQQMYAMRHPHCHSNQSSAHGGMAFFGVQPPCPMNQGNSSCNPSVHGGATSVDTTVRVRSTCACDCACARLCARVRACMHGCMRARMCVRAQALGK